MGGGGVWADTPIIQQYCSLELAYAIKNCTNIHQYDKLGEDHHTSRYIKTPQKTQKA